MKVLALAILVITTVACTRKAPTAPPQAEQPHMIPFVVSLPASQPNASPSDTLAPTQSNLSTLVLTRENTITFRGVVTSQKVAEIQQLLMAKATELPKDATLYLVLDTPGGDIDAGNQLIDTVHSIPQKVKTLTVFAASMGFQFVQNMDERLIVPSGTLMSHRARFGGLSGQAPGEIQTRLNFWMATITRLDIIAAKRMGMSLEAYQSLVHDEYWVSGFDAVAAKAADKVIVARCDATLSGTTKELLGTIFGMKVFGTMSECPVITGILGVSVEGGDAKATAKAQEYVNRQIRDITFGDVK